MIGPEYFELTLAASKPGFFGESGFLARPMVANDPILSAGKVLDVNPQTFGRYASQHLCGQRCPGSIGTDWEKSSMFIRWT